MPLHNDRDRRRMYVDGPGLPSFPTQSAPASNQTAPPPTTPATSAANTNPYGIDLDTMGQVNPGVHVGGGDYSIDPFNGQSDFNPSSYGDPNMLDSDGDGYSNWEDDSPNDPGEHDAPGGVDYNLDGLYIPGNGSDSGDGGSGAGSGDDSDGSPYQEGWNDDGTYVEDRDGGLRIVNFDEELANLDRNSGTYAQDAFGVLTRAQWQDYVQRFQPIEDEVSEAIEAGPGRDVDAIERNVADAFNGGFFQTTMRRSEDQFDRQIGRLGIDMSPEQKAARDRTMNISKAATTANETNRHMDNVQDRRMRLLAGTSSATKTVKNPDED